MSENPLYRLLDTPWVFRLSQSVGAPGHITVIKNKIEKILHQHPTPRRLLDVGCGPSSWLWRVGLHPIGLDLSASYTREFARTGELSVRGSAASLPFADGTFDSVWTVFVLHHLSDEVAQRTIREMLRVCRVGGYTVIIDGVMPRRPITRPVAWLLRRMDRGNHVRDEQQFRALVPTNSCTTQRITYAATGVEAMVFVTLKR
ncbi:MAG: class I SAM-dependent methyltransferase [Verrucomicrobiia bacterium]